MNAASACASYNAPGLGGNVDPPEYQGPTVDELVTQKLGDVEWLDVWKNDFVTKDILGLIFLSPEDFLAAVHRIRFEARQCAEREAREEYQEARRKFCEENS